MPASQQLARPCRHVPPNVSPLDHWHFEAILPTGVLQPVRACAYGYVRARLDG